MDIDIHVLSYFVAIYSFGRNIRNDMVADLNEKWLTYWGSNSDQCKNAFENLR